MSAAASGGVQPAPWADLNRSGLQPAPSSCIVLYRTAALPPTISTIECAAQHVGVPGWTRTSRTRGSSWNCTCRPLAPIGTPARANRRTTTRPGAPPCAPRPGGRAAKPQRRPRSARRRSPRSRRPPPARTHRVPPSPPGRRDAMGSGRRWAAAAGGSVAGGSRGAVGVWRRLWAARARRCATPQTSLPAVPTGPAPRRGDRMGNGLPGLAPGHRPGGERQPRPGRDRIGAGPDARTAIWSWSPGMAPRTAPAAPPRAGIRQPGNDGRDRGMTVRGGRRGERSAWASS